MILLVNSAIIAVSGGIIGGYYLALCVNTRSVGTLRLLRHKNYIKTPVKGYDYFARSLYCVNSHFFLTWKFSLV